MHEKESLFFLTADFGAPSLDQLRENFPDRFINTGIAEQNLINVATGLAMEGAVVYAYAIAPFLTMRAFEQIRINLSLQSYSKKLNVNLIGVGAGLSYDVSGPTHHCIEDIILMRLLPNFTVFSPSDWILTEKIVDQTVIVNKPKYLRLDAKPLPEIYKKADVVKIEDGFRVINKGKDTCIVSTGYMTHTASKAVKRLKGSNINAGLIDMFCLKPVNEEKLFETLRRYRCIVTLEEAFINKGGMDSVILSILNKNKSGIILKNIGFEDKYIFEYGGREHLHRSNGLDIESIVNTVKDCYLQL